MMKKLFFASLYALVVAGFGFAIAQNLNRSVQLSQSPIGPIGVDSTNGVYFPTKINTLGGVPSITGFGTGSIVGSDLAGHIVTGTNATFGAVAFRAVYTSSPYCVVSGFPVGTATPVGIESSPGGFSVTYGQSVGLKLYYICIGRATG